jgi:DNA-binding response OmpR family regulator
MSEKGIALLVEDDAKILEINRRVLEREGILVLTAKTLSKAREQLKLAIPDVAVLDIMLPDGSGIDFLSELRRVCQAPVLFLTAKTEFDDVLAGLTAGGNDYITKPYDIDEFRMRVVGFLRLVGSIHQDMRTQDSSVLTEKELAVALLAAQGFSNKEIADKVFLSESRVKTCLSGIYSKLGISDKDNKRDLLAEVLNS